MQVFMQWQRQLFFSNEKSPESVTPERRSERSREGGTDSGNKPFLCGSFS
jgi:hypothetical protein